MAAPPYHRWMDEHDGIGPWIVSITGGFTSKMTAFLISAETGKAVRHIESSMPSPEQVGFLDLISPVDDESSLVAVAISGYIQILDINQSVSSWIPLARLPHGYITLVAMINGQGVALGMDRYRGGELVFCTPRMTNWVTLSQHIIDIFSCNKDECFYLLGHQLSDKVYSLRFPHGFLPTSRPQALKHIQDITFDLVPSSRLTKQQYYNKEESRSWSTYWHGRLVRSHDALFLVRYRLREFPQPNAGEKKFIFGHFPDKQIHISKLVIDGERNKGKWDSVESLDGCAFFLNRNVQSFALSINHFPKLKPDHIYFSAGNHYDTHRHLSAYNLKDGTVTHLRDISRDKDRQFMWMMPHQHQKYIDTGDLNTYRGSPPRSSPDQPSSPHNQRGH